MIRSMKSRVVKTDHIAMHKGHALKKTKRLKGVRSFGATLMNKRVAADNVRLKRAYQSSAADDGTRILIDRLWPRGVKKIDADIDQWAEGHRSKHCIAEMVRPRSCPVAGVSPPVRCGGPQASRTAQTGYVPWQDKARSRSFTRLATRFITTPSR